jgi:hypothetical protein
MFGDLVDADEGMDPPLLRFLVDLALAHDEARVQPAVAVVLRQQFEPRDDRSARPRLLLDALPVDGQEDVGVVRGPNDAAQVRRPHAVLSSARGIGPSDGSLQHVSRDRPIARAEPRALPSAERSGPCSIGIPHRSRNSRSSRMGRRRSIGQFRPRPGGSNTHIHEDAGYRLSCSVSSARGWIPAYCALRNTPALRPIARLSASAVGSRSIISY